MNAPWLSPPDDNYMKAFLTSREHPALPQEEEGKLSVDVYETPTDVVVKAPIAGVKPEHLDISLSNDMLTIRGKRQDTEDAGRTYLSRECHWGSFSRTVILPITVQFEKSRASFEQGVLTVRMPKQARGTSIPLDVTP